MDYNYIPSYYKMQNHVLTYIHVYMYMSTCICNTTCTVRGHWVCVRLLLHVPAAWSAGVPGCGSWSHMDG